MSRYDFNAAMGACGPGVGCPPSYDDMRGYDPYAAAVPVHGMMAGPAYWQIDGAPPMYGPIGWQIGQTPPVPPAPTPAPAPGLGQRVIDFGNRETFGIQNKFLGLGAIALGTLAYGTSAGWFDAKKRRRT